MIFYNNNLKKNTNTSTLQEKNKRNLINSAKFVIIFISQVINIKF